MEDKTFELLEKMYADLKNEIQHVGNKVTKLEHETNIKFSALFDGYKQTYEKLQEHDKRFDEHDKRFDDIENKLNNISAKVSSHDSKLEVLEGGRKK